MKQTYQVILNVNDDYQVKFECTSIKQIFNIMKSLEATKLNQIEDCTLEIRVYEGIDYTFTKDEIHKEFKYFNWTNGVDAI